jgi:hypothetical protein
MLQFILTAPPQDHEPSISSTIRFAHLRTSLYFTYLIQKLTNGAPTLHPFFTKFLPSLGHSFHTGAPVSVFVHISPNYFITSCTNPCILRSFTLVVTIGGMPSFWPHATHVTLGWSISYHLPSPASSISLDYYPGHLPFIL